jgi:two-component system OmpR family response regulator
MASANVLIVDDETEFSSVIAERMRNRGLMVDTAESGMAALEMIKKKSYDAVILDMAMPEMDGFETLQRMLDINKDLQIIFLTGHATVEKGVEAVKMGAVDFLEKPADLTTLMGKISEAQQNKMLLFEKGLEDKMSDIMKKRGW